MSRDSPSSGSLTTNTVSVTLDRQSDGGLGFSLGSENPSCISSISPDGPAQHVGLRRGDVLLSINGEDVTALAHNAVVERLKSSNHIEMQVQRSSGGGAATEEPVDAAPESPQSDHRAPALLSDAELEAYKPFSDLDLLLENPPHMATFLNFVLSPQGVTEDETLYLLNLNWFLEEPAFNAARTLYNDFLATKAPMRISCVPDDVMQTVEQALSTKKPTSAMLRQAFKPTQAVTREHVGAVVREFYDHLREGYGDLCQATRLIHLSKSEELRLVEDMIHQHVWQAQARQSDAEEKHVAARFSIVLQTLVRFYLRAGGDSSKFSNTKTRQLSRKDTQKVDFYHMGHRFVTTTYTHPTFCAVCRAMILGLVRQGWDCIDCGMHVHKKNDKFSSSFRRCHTQVKERCSGMKKSRSLFGSSRRKKGSKHTKASYAGTALEEVAAAALDKKNKSHSSSSLATESSTDLSLSMSRSKSSSSKSLRSNLSTRRGTNSVLPYNLQNEPEFWQETVHDKTLVASLTKGETKRQELIYELIQTEKRFVRHLSIFKELFRKPVIAENVLSSSAVHGLFANVDDLLENNRPIADVLEQRRAERQGTTVNRIADVLLPYFRSFNQDAYARFCSGQQRALKLYNQQMKGNQAFADCVHKIEKLPDIERLTFRDFVAKPMQRLTKYPLLIEGILKGTTEDNTKEREGLAELLELAKGVLHHVQHVIRSTEDKKRLCEIDDKLDRSHLDRLEKLMLNDLPSSGFELIHEESLQLKCQGRLVDVQCILLTHTVIFCQRKDERLVVKIPEKTTNGRPAVVAVRDIFVRPVAADAKSFFLISGNKSSPTMYELRAQTKSKAKAWPKRLEEARTTFNENYPHYEETLMRQLTEQSKLEDDDDEEEEEEDEDEEEEAVTVAVDEEQDEAADDDDDLDVRAFMERKISQLHEHLSKIEDVHAAISARLMREGLEHCLVAASPASSTRGSAQGSVRSSKRPSRYEAEESPVRGISRQRYAYRSSHGTGRPSAADAAARRSSHSPARLSPASAEHIHPNHGSSEEVSAVPESDTKDIWYAAQYARTAERAAQLSSQVADLQHRLVQSQALEEDAAFDAPPAVPVDEEDEPDAQGSGDEKRRSLVLRPPVDEISHESFI